MKLQDKMMHADNLRGFYGMFMREIIKASGSRRPTTWNAFKMKDHLFRIIIDLNMIWQ